MEPPVYCSGFNELVFANLASSLISLDIMLRPLESAFLIMFPIQLSTFLMTLVRKSIISNKTWHIIYGISLLIPYLITINKEQKDYIKPLLSIIFIISRLYFHVNKYTLMILTVYLFIIIM